MIPGKDLQEKVQDHFVGHCKYFFELSSGWELSQFSNEQTLISPCVSFALARHTLEGLWEMPGGISRIRRIVRAVTEYMMKHGAPAPHRIDPKVAKFVWVEEELEPEPHH